MLIYFVYQYIPFELLPIPLNSLIHLLSKWHSLFCFFAAGAALAILRSALAEFAAVGRVRVPCVCATPSQQSAQSRIMFVTRMRRREVGGG